MRLCLCTRHTPTKKYGHTQRAVNPHTPQPMHTANKETDTSGCPTTDLRTDLHTQTKRLNIQATCIQTPTPQVNAGALHITNTNTHKQTNARAHTHPLTH